MYYRSTLRPEDISAWGPLQHLPDNVKGPRKSPSPTPFSFQVRAISCTCSRALGGCNVGVDWPECSAYQQDGEAYTSVRKLERGRSTLFTAFSGSGSRRSPTPAWCYWLFFEDTLQDRTSGRSSGATKSGRGGGGGGGGGGPPVLSRSGGNGSRSLVASGRGRCLGNEENHADGGVSRAPACCHRQSI